MGRDKPKKYQKMGYQQKESYVKSELQKLGGSGVYYDDGGARGSASTGMFDLEESEAQLKKLASNDYSRRDSIKYGVDAGNKHFKDVGNGGFGSMTELVNADRAIHKVGKNLGHKNTSSSNDYADISSHLFNKSRDKFSKGITDDISNDINGLREEIEKNEGIKEQADAEPKSFVHSDAVAGAQDRVNKYKLNLGQGDLFGRMNKPSHRADNQKDATRSFADFYKDDVIEAVDLVEDKARNLNNALGAINPLNR